MAEKILNTRIQLKYDTLANWNTNNPVLKSGEAAVATVTTATKDDKGNIIHVPTTLIKVGDGTSNYKALPFVSAPAADVYGWAKAQYVLLVDEKLVFSNNANGSNPIHEVDLSKFALDADIGAVSDLATDAETVVGAINEHDAEIGNLANLSTENKGDLVTAINEVRQAVEVGGTGSVVTVRKDSKDKYTVRQGDSDVAVPIEIADGELTMSAGEGLVATQTVFTANDEENKTFTVSHGEKPLTGTASNTPGAREYVTSVVLDKFGHVASVTTATETVIDTNTAHTHTNGKGTTASGGGTEGEVAVNLNIGIKLDSTTAGSEKIVIYDKTSNEELASMSAASLVEDSYLSDVDVETKEGDDEYLVFTFTLNDGTTKTVDVDLNKLVDVYNADEVSLTKDDHTFSIKEGGIQPKHLSTEAVTSIVGDINDGAPSTTTATGIIRSFDFVTGSSSDNTAYLDLNVTGATNPTLAEAVFEGANGVEITPQNYNHIKIALDSDTKNIIDKAVTTDSIREEVTAYEQVVIGDEADDGNDEYVQVTHPNFNNDNYYSQVSLTETATLLLEHKTEVANTDGSIDVAKSEANNTTTFTVSVSNTIKNGAAAGATAVQTVTAPANETVPSGISVNRSGNDVTLKIDDTLTWIFDCGDSNF